MQQRNAVFFFTGNERGLCLSPHRLSQSTLSVRSVIRVSTCIIGRVPNNNICPFLVNCNAISNLTAVSNTAFDYVSFVPSFPFKITAAIWKR